MATVTLRSLARVELSDRVPPREFRLFRAGENETTKGTFLFDDRSAQAVMAQYRAHGIDLMVDYDHASLDVGVDPALSGRAAGWFELEVRDGELWAVNVRWTPAAAAALADGEWRFMSPAFEVDEEMRVVRVLNVAITNMPATRRLTPLVAASRRHMSPEQAKQALAVIAEGDGDAALSLLQALLAGAASDGEESDPSEPNEPADQDEQLADDEEEELSDDDEEEEPPAQVKASRVALARERERLAQERAQLARERAAFERNERDALVVELAKQLSPALAWAEPLLATDRKKRTPAPQWARLSLGELRDVVARLKRQPSARSVVPPTPAVEHGLTARELKVANQIGMKPDQYAELKARKVK